MTEPRPTTILVVDDELDMRMLVRVVIELANHGLTVVAEAADGDEAIDACQSLADPQPDVVILDNRMPRASGLDVAVRILECRPDQVIVLFSAFLDDDVRAQATEVGIARCVSKDEINRLPEVIWELIPA